MRCDPEMSCDPCLMGDPCLICNTCDLESGGDPEKNCGDQGSMSNPCVLLRYFGIDKIYWFGVWFGEMSGVEEISWSDVTLWFDELSWYKGNPEKDKLSTGLGELNLNKLNIQNVPKGSDGIRGLKWTKGERSGMLLTSYPVFHGWRREMRLAGFMQRWRTKYCHNKHLIQYYKCGNCLLGEYRWNPEDETEKIEQYLFRWESKKVKKNLKPAVVKGIVIQDGVVYNEGRLSPEFQFKTKDLDQVGYLDKHEHRYNSDLSSCHSKDIWKQVPEKIISWNGVYWMCLISLGLKMDRKKDCIMEKMSVQPEIMELLCELPVSAESAIRGDIRGVEEFYSLISREEVRLERGVRDLFTLTILAGYKFQSKNMIAMGVQIQGTLLIKNVSTVNVCMGVRWQLIPESLRCYALDEIMFGFVTYNVLTGLLFKDDSPGPDILCRFWKCNQKTAVVWFLEFVVMSLEGEEFHLGVEERAETREGLIRSLSDTTCSKESVCWKLGRVTGVKGSKITLNYSLTTKRWSLLEWTRMEPLEMSKFFLRMEKDVGFQQFYGGLYDGMRLCHVRIFNERAPVVEEVEKRLRLAVCNSLEEKTECLKKSGAETRVRRKRMVWLDKLSSDWEYEERTRWKDENPALSTPKKRSRVKRRNSSRPSKLKRMRMRSLKVSGAGSTAEEPAGIPQSQPTPGPSGVRNDFRGEVSGPQQEDGLEEVVVLEEDDDIFLEEKEEKVQKKKRMSAAPGFSRRVIERPLTHDEILESIPRSVFSDEEEMELEVPWEDRLF